MNDIKDKHREAFKEEARELLAELETSLLELEERPDDADLIGRVFRAMHTIKGSGAMFGFEALSAFTHEVETVFDLVRNGSIPITKELIDLTLAARDHIRSMLNASDGAPEVDKDKAHRIISSLRKLIPNLAATVKVEQFPSSVVAGPQSERADQEITCRIHFRPPQDIAFRGIDPISLLNELSQLGECTITARTQDVSSLEELNAESCYLCWDVILTTSEGLNAVKDVFLFIQDDAEVKIDIIKDSVDGTDAGQKKLGDILVERGEVTPEIVQKGLSAQKKFGQVLVDMGALEADE